MLGYIYKIKNDINNKVYIGKTTKATIKERFEEHLNDYKKRQEEHRPLYTAMKKYGAEHFYIEEIEKVDIYKLEEREKYWINYYDSYKNGYNATLGGDGKILYDYEQILNLYNQGLLQKEIAVKIGCSTDTVAKVLNLNNIDTQSNRYNKLKHSIVAEKFELKYNFNSQMDAARWLIQNKITTSSDPDNVCGSIGRALKNNKKYLGYKWKYTEDR